MKRQVDGGSRLAKSDRVGLALLLLPLLASSALRTQV